MRKVKEILRLRFGLGLQQNQIARSCSIGQATVHRYLRKAAAAGLTWPLPEDLDDRRLEELLFPAAVGRPSQLTRPMPDFDEVRRQLQDVLARINAELDKIYGPGDHGTGPQL